MTKKIKEIHGERPKALSDEDYQAILDAEEGIFYLTKPEMSEVEKRQAEQRIKLVADFGDMKIFEGDTATVDAYMKNVLGKRFIGIAEVGDEPMDSESVMRLT